MCVCGVNLCVCGGVGGWGGGGCLNPCSNSVTMSLNCIRPTSPNGTSSPDEDVKICIF